MDPLTTLMNEPVVHTVGWALIHSLWQGTLIALLLALTLRLFRGASSRWRYLLSCTAMISVIALTVATAVYMTDAKRDDPGAAAVYLDAQPVAGTAPLASTALPDTTYLPTPTGAETNPIEVIEHCLPWVVAAWLAGLLLVSCRMLFGWASLHRLRHQGSTPASHTLQARVTELGRVMGIRRTVVVLSSTRAAVPMVVGWLRPVILLPASCITGLSSQQLEAILAHELAHIARYDYLVNLLQCVAETLLFYHPAVWWIGRTIRRERERCCDDQVVRLTGDRAEYARALLHLAEMSTPHRARLSLASQGGDLSGRVRRLLGRESAPANNRWSAGLWTALASLCVAGLFVAGALAEDGPTGTDDSQGVADISSVSSPADESQASRNKRIIGIPYDKLFGEDADASYNIAIRPGDIIKIQEKSAPQFVYINGDTKRPGAYSLPKSGGLTLKQLVVTSGRVESHSPSYIDLVRRVAPDQEQILHFSLDDIMEGWVPDAFLAENDVVMIKNEPGQEDEQARSRRLLRERIMELYKHIAELRIQYDKLAEELGKEHSQVQMLAERIKQSDEELAAAKEKLVPDVTVRPITPAPDPFAVGTPPRAADRVNAPLPNSAKPYDWVELHASLEGDPMFQTKLVRRVDEQGVLSLPGLAPTPFLGRPIDEIEGEILTKMQANPDYRQAERVVVTLPNQWTFTAIGSLETSTRSGVYSIPRSDFRLQDALAMIRTDASKWDQLIVIRQEPTATAP